VIYGVAEKVKPDPASRLNCFAHVNHTSALQRIGLLLCINGCGIMNKLARQWAGPQMTYGAIDEMASSIDIGSNGMTVLPFGNGAERMLHNRLIGAHILHLDLNLHTPAHFFRAVQEGIVFSFRYGLDIMREMGMDLSVIRAGHANNFRSPVFLHAFVNVTGTPVELFDTDGARGAALGAGIGLGCIGENELDKGLTHKKLISPDNEFMYEKPYQRWKESLQKFL
jgi:xylulokinase